MMAATLMGKTYEWCVENKSEPSVQKSRKLAKVANFGLPGGLGSTSLVQYAKAGYKVILTPKESITLCEGWRKTWPEVVDYMSYVRNLPEVASDVYGTARLARQVYSGRIRGNCTYTAAANTHFQGLGSDATKHAGFLLSKACYTEPSSPLFGSRIVSYIQDEFLLEVPEGGPSEAAEELAGLMIIG